LYFQGFAKLAKKTPDGSLDITRESCQIVFANKNLNFISDGTNIKVNFLSFGKMFGSK
jgi:hypothetical protein